MCSFLVQNAFTRNGLFKLAQTRRKNHRTLRSHKIQVLQSGMHSPMQARRKSILRVHCSRLCTPSPSASCPGPGGVEGATCAAPFSSGYEFGSSVGSSFDMLLLMSVRFYHRKVSLMWLFGLCSKLRFFSTALSRSEKSQIYPQVTQVRFAVAVPLVQLFGLCSNLRSVPLDIQGLLLSVPQVRSLVCIPM